MKKELVKIILGTAHRKREPGKQSPDGRLKECEYSRERVNGIKAKLEALGYTVLVDMEAMDLPTAMQQRKHRATKRACREGELCECRLREVWYGELPVCKYSREWLWYTG